MIGNEELILYLDRMTEFTQSVGFFKGLYLKWLWWRRHEAWCPKCGQMTAWSVADKKEFTRIQCGICGLGVVLRGDHVYDVFIQDV